MVCQLILSPFWWSQHSHSFPWRSKPGNHICTGDPTWSWSARSQHLSYVKVALIGFLSCKSGLKTTLLNNVSCSVVSDSAIPWTVTHQGPLSTEFSREEYWSGLPYPFSRGSSWPRDWTRVSCIAGRFCTIWATRALIDFYFLQIRTEDYFAKQRTCKLRSSG